MKIGLFSKGSIIKVFPSHLAVLGTVIRELRQTTRTSRNKNKRGHIVADTLLPWAEQLLCTCVIYFCTFLCRPLQNNNVKWLKALVNEDTLLRTHCCPWCFLGYANWETFVADTKYFWTKSETFFVSRTQNLCPQQMLRARTNGETFVSATMCPFARAFNSQLVQPGMSVSGKCFRCSVFSMPDAGTKPTKQKIIG